MVRSVLSTNEKDAYESETGGGGLGEDSIPGPFFPNCWAFTQVLRAAGKGKKMLEFQCLFVLCLILLSSFWFIGYNAYNILVQ